MPSNYEFIESEFIRAQLRETDRDHSTYIRDLVKLYYYIINAPGTWVGTMYFSALRNRYQDEFLILLGEINPALQQREVKRRAERERERRRWEEE